MIDVFDDDENYVDTVTKSVAREQNLPRRGTDVLVFNPKGELLIHKRAPDKRSYANQWDFRITGWVISPETTAEAAMRELEEEIGARDTEVKFLFKYRLLFGYINNDFSYVYSTVYDGKITIEEDEISEYRWINPAELEKLMEKMDFAPNAKKIFEKTKDRLFEIIAEKE